MVVFFPRLGDSAQAVGCWSWMPSPKLIGYSIRGVNETSGLLPRLSVTGSCTDIYRMATFAMVRRGDHCP